MVARSSLALRQRDREYREQIPYRIELQENVHVLRRTIPVSGKTRTQAGDVLSISLSDVQSSLATSAAIIATAPSVALYSRCFQYKSQENVPRLSSNGT